MRSETKEVLLAAVVLVLGIWFVTAAIAFWIWMVFL